MPEEANRIMECFENYYIRVTNNIELTFPRTQNNVEVWHRRWETLVGHAHVGVYKILGEIQKEQNQLQLSIESILQVGPQSLQRKKDHEREECIQTVYSDRDNRELMDFL
ncbi:hypothetical protein GLOIN_2v1446576 [Rhizophagus clarus]|uniref:Uncharacterized protein n=1 Tax=Rhizophagus clarus TaxID=94130 RepID=A0A8H3MGN9_9GLOM|nr:hypothetical protein GLOIN_2v1446576 [Rhizophagus clarus]